MSSPLRERLFSNLKVIGEESEGQYGYFPDRRPIEVLLNYGLIPLDKPPGQTSHQVVAWVKRILNVQKAGHSGTLDPPATGLLPIATEEATKVLGIFLLGPKEYYAIMRLHSPVPDEEIKQVVSEFTGPIYQRPPVRSSVKRQRRVRHIYGIEIVERKGNLVLLRIVCQAGTYVRKLIYDMGEVLGVGATMVELRRTRVCELTEEKGFVRLHELAYAMKLYKEKGIESLLREYVRPIEEGILGVLKIVVAKDSAVDAICHGAYLAVPGIARIDPTIRKDDLVAILTQKAELVALAKAEMSAEEIEDATKGIAFTPKRVVMKPGTYPKAWKGKSSNKD